MPISSTVSSILKWLFGMPEVTIPEGMSESCFVNGFRMFYDFPSFPTYDCNITAGRDSMGWVNSFNENGSLIITESSEVVQNAISLDPALLSSAFIMLIAVSIFGITLCELLNNKLIYLLEPFICRVEKRLVLVTERNRLSSMNGHP